MLQFDHLKYNGILNYFKYCDETRHWKNINTTIKILVSLTTIHLNSQFIEEPTNNFSYVLFCFGISWDW